MKARGIALHYFDGEASSKTGEPRSDKFYRMYLYKTALGNYQVLSNWGRDNPGVEGQTKVESFADFAAAKAYMVKLGDAKMRKGYEYLGEADVEFDKGWLSRSGTRLLQATGRTPTKIAGFSVNIQEEDDIFDLLGISPS